jgi:integrase
LNSEHSKRGIFQGKTEPRLVVPSTENRTSRRPKIAVLRSGEHLTIDEVERLIKAASNNRHGHRDALMMLLSFRHGLRAAEICDLCWEQVDFKTANLHVRRAKNGTPSTHPLTGRELLSASITREQSFAIRVRLRARRAADRSRLLAHGRARDLLGWPGRQGPRAYAASALLRRRVS